MQPLVSILIPAYNAEQFIADTLNSALRQQWSNTEIIVVDDGSKDATLQIARTFESRGVRVITQKNAGAAAARNHAFALSRGDYIQWLDADDLLAADKISRQMAVCQREQLDDRTLLSGPWGRFLFRPRRAEFVPTALWADLTATEWLLRKMEQNLHMQTSTWLVSRALTEAAGPWNTALLGDDDGEYFCRVLFQSRGVRFVPEANVFYRMTGHTSLSSIGRSNAKVEAQFRSMQLYIDYLMKHEDSQRSRAACVAYLQNWVSIFHPDRPDIVERIQQLARQFGGEVLTPPLSWKYRWIQMVLGDHMGKSAQTRARQLRWSLTRAVDRTLSRWDPPAARLV